MEGGFHSIRKMKNSYLPPRSLAERYLRRNGAYWLKIWSKSSTLKKNSVLLILIQKSGKVAKMFEKGGIMKEKLRLATFFWTLECRR